MSKSMALPSAIAVLLGFSESVLPEMGRVDASQDAPVIQFRIAQDSAGPNFIKMEGPSGSVYVAAQSFLSDTDIQHATASILTEYLVIKIQFTPTGISVLKRATRERIGSRLALLVDSRVIADGVIRSELGTSITVGLKLADLPPGYAEEVAAKVEARWPDLEQGEGLQGRHGPLGRMRDHTQAANMDASQVADTGFSGAIVGRNYGRRLSLKWGTMSPEPSRLPCNSFGAVRLPVKAIGLNPIVDSSTNLTRRLRSEPDTSHR